jgi:hypothetical protein
VIVPAFRGELGLKIRYHVPWVYAKGPGHVVEIEEGEEALYPLAAEWRIVPRNQDDSRHGGPGRLQPQKRFVPEPYVRQGITADLVLCPRKRNYGSSKNWNVWPWLALQLEVDGFNVFAAGAPDSSYDVACPRAWDYPRFLDASIEAMRSARLVIATDAGLAHLAVLCGAPLLLITHRGLVAPGPVTDSKGRVFRPEYWPVRLQEYYRDANHTGSPIEAVDGWMHPERVLEKAKEMALQCW